MAEFVFTSPGAKFKERDITFVTRNVGVTTLGLVGETMKGPAFEHVFIQDKTQFAQRFGAQNVSRFSSGQLQYQLPYVANSYLEESSQLWVTRVLGLSGYDAGNAWAITLNAGVDPTTTGSTTTSSSTEQFDSAGFYLGVALNASGDTGVSFSGYTKQNDGTFKGYSHSFTADTVTLTGGTVTDVVTEMTGTSHTKYENMVLAVIRSRGTVQNNVNLPPTTTFEATSILLPSSANTTNSGIGDLFGQFQLIAVSGASREIHSASLNPNSSSFLPNVIGSTPKDKKNKIWVQAIYPDLIQKLDADGISYGINSVLIKCSSDFYTDYKTQFKTPETPWVVSQLKGSNVDKLFKFVSISDGDAGNQEIKISITNINPVSLEFDVVIRDFNDTDDNVKTLESFTRCSMIKGQTNYIAQRIGTTDGEYDLQSKYVMIELAPEIAADVFPAGFEGYQFNNYAKSATSDSSTAGVAPKIFYKTKYDTGDRYRKVYLGVSETGYAGTGVIGTGINQNFFNFNGLVAVGSHVNTDGFHMDSGATEIYDGFNFEVGAGKFGTINDILDPTNPYYDIATRKFTLAPAGGFDGWDANRLERSNTDNYRTNGIWDGVKPNGLALNDFQAWETAINTFANPEEVTINVFATPGINWSDNTVMIQDTLEMIETQRTDSLYVIDSPDIGLRSEERRVG